MNKVRVSKLKALFSIFTLGSVLLTLPACSSIVISGCTPNNGGYKSATDPKISNMLKATVALRDKSDADIVGSGVILKYRKGERIVVLTAQHVSDHLENEMYISTRDKDYKDKIPAHAVRNSSTLDLSLVVSNEPATSDGPEASLARGEPGLGETLYIVGSPNGHDYNISRGVLSSVFKDDDTGLKWYRTDTDIYFGNSGGPVFNSSGYIVAIAVAVETGYKGIVPGGGLLVPIDTIWKFCFGTSFGTIQ